MYEDKKQRFEDLVKTDPGQFLYEVYRNSPFEILEAEIYDLGDFKKINRAWAVDPAHDGLRAIFNFRASGKKKSLRRLVSAHVETRSGKWQKLEELPAQGGRLASVPALDKDALTARSLLEEMKAAINIGDALLKREPENKRLLEARNFCEETLLPLLQELPPDKSLGQYQAQTKSRQPRP